MKILIKWFNIIKSLAALLPFHRNLIGYFWHSGKTGEINFLLFERNYSKEWLFNFGHSMVQWGEQIKERAEITNNDKK